MGHTKKRNYDRYTLAYKLQAVKLANDGVSPVVFEEAAALAA
jgi:hypothetical protein